MHEQKQIFIRINVKKMCAAADWQPDLSENHGRWLAGFPTDTGQTALQDKQRQAIGNKIQFKSTVFSD